jgi:hypothetical protein
MSGDDRKLDPELRRRVAALYESESAQQHALDPEAQQRVLRAAVEEAGRLADMRRMRRTLASRALGLGAVAAALVLSLRLHDLWSAQSAPRSPPIAAREPPPAAERQPPCALPFGAAAPAFQRLPDGRSSLDLGAFGQLVADASAQLHVQSTRACQLEIRLQRGALAGDLQQLYPAQLVIHANQADVIVTGTRFGVRSDDQFELVLISGNVDVVLGRHDPLRVAAGTSLRSDRYGAEPQSRRVSQEDERQLSALLSGNSATPSAAEVVAARSGARSVPGSRERTKMQSVDLLQAAEAARRDGRATEARALYRAAGDVGDDNAEVALLRWARFEVEAGDAAAARGVLLRHAQRFPDPKLGAEAHWLNVQVLNALGRRDLAREAARQLARRYPSSPQAAAAQALLEAR